MRKNCTPGSVRGAARKGGSYRGGVKVGATESFDLKGRLMLRPKIVVDVKIRLKNLHVKAYSDHGLYFYLPFEKMGCRE